MQGKISPKSIAVTQYSIPSHIRDENPELVKFFEYYFAWMSQNGNPMDLLTNMEDYRDVDETTPQFIDLITKQFISFIPASSKVNRVMVANHIKDFYKAKGTLPSYDFLLNILTGQHAELTWNHEKVFRPSANSSTRDSTIFVYSTALWNTSCQGSIIEQYYPTEATALVETVSPLVFNNKLINQLDIDPETIHGTFVPNGLVRVLNNTVNRSFIYADVYYTEVATTLLNGVIEDLTVQTYSEPSRTYPGLIVKQVGSNFRAVILSLDSRVVVNNQIQITWTLQNVTGTLGTGDIYLVTAAAEATTFNKGDYQYGSVSPTISGVTITNGGALNETGKDIGYIGGTGSPFIAKINEVGGGGIDTVDITANGYGYSVGDSISVDNSSGGTGFAAVVDKIDGQSASLAVTLELDSVQIANGGNSFAVGDIIYLSDGVYPIESMPTTFTVASINSTLALNQIVVNNGGYGYQYAKVALLDVTSNTLVSTFAATATVKNGIITAITVTTSPTLAHSTLNVLVNGSGASASATTSGGVVNSISVLNGGFNYVNPVVTINTTTIPTRLATITATKDVNGVITGFTIVDGGAGYGASVTVTITELTGAGFTATAIVNNTSTGPVTGLTVTNRGTYTQLPTCFGAPYIVKPVGSLYNPLTIPDGTTLTIPNGTYIQIGGSLGNGLVLNLKYRLKSALVGNPGNHYTYVGIDTTDGIGTGAVINPIIQNGIVTGFTFSNHGSGYTSAQVTIVSPGGGKGFQGVCNISAGQIASVTIISGGVGYSITDTVVFTGNGINAAATITVANGVVTAMTVANGGQNYAFDTALTYVMEPIANPSAVAGSFTPIIQNGAIASVTVNTGGSGYIAGLTNDLKAEDNSKLLTQAGDFIDFDSPYDEPMLVAGTPARIGLSMAKKGSLLAVDMVSGGTGYIDQTELAPLEIYAISNTGVGAVLLPILEKDKLVAVQILHGGTNYKTGDTASVQGGGGTGASITPIIFGGKVVDFIINNHGQNYRYGTSILVVGDGSGADIYPIVNTSIKQVQIANGGANYQNPTISISDISAVLPVTSATSTNLLQASSKLNLAPWQQQNNMVVTPNTDIDPLGTMTADTLTIKSVGSDYLFQPLNLPAGTYTLSQWVKAKSGSVQFKLVTFSSMDGTQWSQQYTATTTWQRFTHTVTVTAGFTNFYGASPNLVSPLVVWGTQVELGYATNYMPSIETLVSRNSVATYFDAAGNIQTAAANVQRYGWDYSSHNFQGQILEPQATNYIQGSEQLDNAGLAYPVWSAAYLNVAPSGTFFAGSIPFFTVTTLTTPIAWWGLVQTLLSVNAGDAYTGTFAVMAGTSNKISFGIYGNTSGWGVNTDSTAEILSGPGTIAQLTGGMWLVTGMSAVTPTLVRISRKFNIVEPTGLYLYPDNFATVGVTNLITRVQVEKGWVPTSYIKTTTGYGTRLADSFTSAIGTRTTKTNEPVVYKTDWQGRMLQSTSPRTNVFPWSENMEHGTVDFAGDVLITNVGIAGDGLTTLDQLTASASAGQHRVYFSVPIDTTDNTVFTVEARQTAATEHILIFLYTGLQLVGASFNLTTGAVIQQMGGASLIATYATQLSAGLWRLSVVCNIVTSNTAAAHIYRTDSVGGQNSTGDGVHGIQIGHVQVEKGSVPTSYIKTNGTAVSVTDFTYTTAGSVTFANAPLSGATLDWSGSYFDVITGQTYNVSTTVFGTGNGTTKTFALLSLGSGSGAILLPVVTNGVITDVDIISGGTHYRNPVLTVTDSTGAGAILNPIVERNIENVNVNTSGMNYVGGETYISGDGDDASMTLFFEDSGSISAPNLYVQGTGYTKTPNFSIIDTSNMGRVTSVKILSSGAQYLTPPNITLPAKFSGTTQIAGGATFICYGDTVGQVNSVTLTSFGADWTEAPLFQFPLSAVLLENANFAVGETITVDRYPYKQAGDVLFDILTEAGDFVWCEFKTGFFMNEDGSYLLNEDSTPTVPDYLDLEDVGDLELEFYEIDTGGGVLAPYYDAGPSAVVFDVDFSRNILELKDVTSSYILVTEDGAEMRSEQDITLVDQYSNGIYIGDTLIGSTTKAEATIKWFNRAAGVHQTSGIGLTQKLMADNVGVLDHSQSKIHDGKRIQDFSYSVQTKAPLFNYEAVVKSTVHPAGYQMYGTMLSGTVATGTHAVTVPFTFGIKGASASFQTKLNEKTGFVNTSLLKYTNLMYYIRTLGFWYTTYGGFLGNYTFEQFDPNSSSFLTSIPPLVALEPWVAPTWNISNATVTTGSDIISGITTPAGVNFNFRVIAWDANGNSIFRENRLKLEDGTYLLNEVGGAYIDTDEDMVHVASFGPNQIQASKISKVTTSASSLTIPNGTVVTIPDGSILQIGTGVTVVVEDVPTLLNNLTTYNTVASPLTINSGQVITINNNTILKIV